jgi:hypothetical protein
MKTKQMRKKLFLNKNTVARLTKKEIENAKGGINATDIILFTTLTITWQPSNCVCTEFEHGTCQMQCCN